MSKVVLLHCEDYEHSHVKKAVQKGIDLLGGAKVFARANEKILLKPNWLAADPPEKQTSTHPMVFKAVAELFKKENAKLSYGDSPGYSAPEVAAKRCGFEKVARELNIPLADFHSGKEIFFEQGVQNKKFVIANGILESDGLISLPKLKTHGFQKLTGCIKNQFGCIPGLLKAEFHVKLPDANNFAKMLVDLNLYLKPRLFIMDGIMAMEGNGPRGGNPKKMNVLLFSQDPVALDATVCRLINIKPEFIPTLVAGKKAGLGTYLEEEIELLGDPLESLINIAFDIEREPIKPYEPRKAMSFIKNRLVPKPYIIEKRCTRCGTCVQVCPVNPKAVDWNVEDRRPKGSPGYARQGDEDRRPKGSPGYARQGNGNKKNPPSYRYDRCIRCYCCQELCPEKAIYLKAPLIRRLFSKKKKK